MASRVERVHDRIYYYGSIYLPPCVLIALPAIMIIKVRIRCTEIGNHSLDKLPSLPTHQLFIIEGSHSESELIGSFTPLPSLAHLDEETPERSL
ncbi:MAG: hypothetical protein NVSMB49_25940 [Ktedonobacteraceae bacterium]